MSMAGSTYPVSRSSGACAETGAPFASGERYVAVLAERDGEPDGALERRDYSLGAWESGARPPAPLRVFAVWRATYQEHPPAKQPLLGDEELLDLFSQLGEADQPKQISFRYVLGLLLVRRRLLRVVGSRHRTAEAPGALLVLPKGQTEGHPIAVIDPGLDDAAIADVIEQLGQVLPGAEAAKPA